MDSNVLNKFCLVILYENIENNEYSIDDQELLGRDYLELIYKSFSDDLLNQFANNLEINIRFINSENHKIFSDIQSEFDEILYVLLIDLYMVANKKFWTKVLSDITNQQYGNSIYPIAFTENFMYMDSFESIHCYRIYKHTNISNILKLQIAQKVLKLLIRKSPDNSVTEPAIFISYTQKDFGVDFAWKFTEWINQNTELEFFLDFYSLPPGDKFEEHINKNIDKEHNLFLAIKTDSYATRTWCIHEILSARKIEIPILVVDAIVLEEKRSFPYLSNCKTIKANIETSENSEITITNIDYIICEAVMELLRVKINELHQNFIINQDHYHDMRRLNKQPDLFNLLYNFKNNEHIENIKTTFLYPDPPISVVEELEIKKLLSKNIDLLPNSLSIMNNSDMQINLYSTILRKYEIGISVATPCNISEYGLIERHLYSYLNELGRYFIYHKITISYGGDIKYSDGMSFMKAFSIMAEYYREDPEYKIVNYLTERTQKRITLKEKIMYENCVQFVEPKYMMDQSYFVDDMIFLSKAQSNMRKYMNELITARVVIGGRITSQKAFSGILEEFMLAMESQKPIYLIGIFGGMTKIIGDLIFGFINPDDLIHINFIGNIELKMKYEALEKKSYDYQKILSSLYQAKNCLNNGLNLLENIELYNCKDPRKAFQLIIKGLINYSKSEIS